MSCSNLSHFSRLQDNRIHSHRPLINPSENLQQRPATLQLRQQAPTDPEQHEPAALEPPGHFPAHHRLPQAPRPVQHAPGGLRARERAPLQPQLLANGQAEHREQRCVMPFFSN